MPLRSCLTLWPIVGPAGTWLCWQVHVVHKPKTPDNNSWAAVSWARRCGWRPASRCFVMMSCLVEWNWRCWPVMSCHPVQPWWPQGRSVFIRTRHVNQRISRNLVGDRAKKVSGERFQGSSGKQQPLRQLRVELVKQERLSWFGCGWEDALFRGSFTGRCQVF